MSVIERGQITAAQYDYLMAKRIRGDRVAHRDAPGRGSKQLSYLEAWDVKANLIRVFGLGNFDIVTERERFIGQREYLSGGDRPKEMLEVIWQATVTLVLRDPKGREIARHTEGAVGQATVSADSGAVGDAHDNALKTAASDALKRCAINLGTQFGLSLYDKGNQSDVVRVTLVHPEGWEPPKQEENPEAQRVLEESLGAVPVTPSGEGTNEGHVSDDHPETDGGGAAEAGAGSVAS